MNVLKDDFDWAVSQGIISQEQADQLWQALSDRMGDRPRFGVANVAYYFGALIVIGAMGWFMTLAWEEFGGAGMFVIACIYALCFVMAGKTLWYGQGLRVPGGLLYTIAVCMTPLAIYGLQRWTGFWHQGDPGVYRDFHVWVRGSWFLMELGAILSGLIALRFVRFPFLTAPIAFSLWYMSMDLTPLIFGENQFMWEQRLLVSMWFGIGCLIIAYWVDLKTRRRDADFAFWLYLFGLLSFWFGITLMGDGTELQRFLYCLINLGLIGLSLLLRRRVFVIFGAMGVFSYLSYLAYQVFDNSLLFPFALSAIGIVVIYLGVLYQKHQRSLERTLKQWLPEWMERFIPQE
jgi:hypothetical protein